MKTIRVTYTVKSSFAEQNIKNIKLFLHELQRLDTSDIHYSVLLAEDGKTFHHQASYVSDEAQKILLALPAFQRFQQQRDASDLEASPVMETLSLIAASYPLSPGDRSV